jgi:hypothetical protein
MTRWNLTLAALVSALLSFALLAVSQTAETPVVLQPGDPAFSYAERTALLAAIEDLDAVLRQGYPIPTYRLTGGEWDFRDADFASFVAGYLKSEGYATFVVEGPDGAGENRIWLLAGIPLETRTAWVPVEIRPAVVGTSGRLGIIPWAAEAGSAFDSSYTSFTHVVQLASHPAPTVIIVSTSGRPVLDEVTMIRASSPSSSSSSIVAYLWTVEGDKETYVETNSAFRYTFTRVGKQDISVVVYDRWGGRATATETVDVLAEHDCGCGG